MIQFGRQQFGKPTPASVGFTLSIIQACCAALIVWLGSPNPIPSNICHTIASFLGLIVLMCIAIKPFFGVDIPGKTVPTEQVTEVETKTDAK